MEFYAAAHLQPAAIELCEFENFRQLIELFALAAQVIVSVAL